MPKSLVEVFHAVFDPSGGGGGVEGVGKRGVNGWVEW